MKRYSMLKDDAGQITNMAHPNGNWVRYEDVAELERELERCVAELEAQAGKSTGRLTAEQQSKIEGVRLALGKLREG